jgi:outer membrane protein TolC
VSRTTIPLLLPFLFVACTAAYHREDADREVYGILEATSANVTGNAVVHSIDRPVDTLRRRLEAKDTSVVLTLAQALDVAAENSRDFLRQKEQLYTVALNLTLQDWNFSTRYGAATSPGVSGVGDDGTQDFFDVRSTLQASRNTTSGGRIVASFVNTFLKDLVRGGSWNGSSILGLSLTQPLLQGFGERIAREPLTQAERNVVYQVRDFERFRATLAVRVVSAYYRVLQQIENLRNEEANVASLLKNREQIEALAEAGLRTQVDVDRARQDEFSARDRQVTARARLDSTLDSFKVTLGLPTDAMVQLAVDELQRLQDRPVELVDLDEETALALAFARRFDHRNVVDDVEDAGRRILVAEDALRSVIDFTAALSVPTDARQPVDFDWSRISWSAGFDVDLAVDKLPERNAYRQALINMDVAIRAREASEDQVKTEIREALRSIRRTTQSYRIQTDALTLARRRVESTKDLYDAGRASALDLLDAQESLLGAQLALTGALIDYSVARLELLRDLEGLVLEPKGLRFDPALPVPKPPLVGGGVPLPTSGAAGDGETQRNEGR